ncbi:MAG TPA: hypothetical protein VFJ82_07665 [Longimicrobium sp.]|nr:hypothetical protein [Longimicrobium sp.]
MIAEAHESFWAAVRECLIEFHGSAELDAVRKVAEFRSRLEQAPPGVSLDMIYHAEPFDVACDIAHEQLDCGRFGDEYLALLQRTYRQSARPPIARPAPSDYRPAVGGIG